MTPLLYLINCGKFKVIFTLKIFKLSNFHNLISVTFCEIDHLSPNTIPSLKEFKQASGSNLKVKVRTKTSYYHKYQPRN